MLNPPLCGAAQQTRGWWRSIFYKKPPLCGGCAADPRVVAQHFYKKPPLCGGCEADPRVVAQRSCDGGVVNNVEETIPHPLRGSSLSGSARDAHMGA